MCELIGRKAEKVLLLEWIHSKESEFIAVYGRRRVGKTFLVRKVVGEEMTFYISGMDNATMENQLLNFTLSLRKAASDETLPVPKNWLLAFDLLERFLEKLPKGKKTLFFDEMPWMDTPRSGFLPALEHFWNTWASARKDVNLIACGSATSWMLNKLINNRGGLHNRLTHKILLQPFTLSETEAYLKKQRCRFSRKDIAECYMVMGGVPFYLKQIQKEYSMTQNIDRIFFEIGAPLDGEFDNLYRSLFKYSENYIRIVEALSTKQKGLTRLDLIAMTGLTNNGALTTMLNELETCGFIRRYNPFSRIKKQSLYQLVDFYTLFYFHFIRRNHFGNEKFWSTSYNSPIHASWSGYAFEMLCLCHVKQMKQALGIAGVQTNVASWRSKKESEGAQIDLVIDRADNVVNVCEMKFHKSAFSISSKYEKELRNKVSLFMEETSMRKSVMLTLVTTYGIKQNEYSSEVQKELVLDDLFSDVL